MAKRPHMLNYSEIYGKMSVDLHVSPLLSKFGQVFMEAK